MRVIIISCSSALLFGILFHDPMEASAAETGAAAGVVYQEGGSISPNANYSGAALQLWPARKHAVQLGVAVETEGNRNVSFHGEYQRHFLRSENDLHSLFAGAGVFYEDAPGDDWIAAYAPMGFRLQLQNYPVSFTVSTAVRLFFDPESSVEIFDEIRLGAFYEF